jgi:hypothetical protein
LKQAITTDNIKGLTSERPAHRTGFTGVHEQPNHIMFLAEGSELIYMRGRNMVAVFFCLNKNPFPVPHGLAINPSVI